MSGGADLRAELRQRAEAIAQQLAPAQRETLLVKCWMAHDARWFAAAAAEHGMAAANRLNRRAVRETGRVEAGRILRALELPAPTSLDDYLLLQEVMIRLLGPDLLDYAVEPLGERAFRLDVRRCFAAENVARAGVAREYDCGILPRLEGWLEALGLAHAIEPAPERCRVAQGLPCSHAISLAREPQETPSAGGCAA